MWFYDRFFRKTDLHVLRCTYISQEIDQTLFQNWTLVLRRVAPFLSILSHTKRISRWYVDVTLRFQVFATETEVITRNFNFYLSKIVILSFCESISHVNCKLIFSKNIVFFPKTSTSQISISAIQCSLSWKFRHFYFFLKKI